MKSITAFLVALVVAAPVAAQSIIPREGPATADREGKFSGDLARKTMDQFAACVLDRRRKPVLEALAMPADSPEQYKLFGYLAKTECIASAELHFNGPAFRGSLYKALVRKQFGRKDVFPATAPGASPQTTPEENSARFPGETGLLKFASCVIHKDPTNARVAILSTAGSPNEDDAMAALANVYGQCLYEDNTLRFSKGRLLGLLAEAYYRDASASVEPSAAK
ncbi:MAG: hypothetical protein WDO72_13550 [Pseudomonadota bacterium]